MLLSKIEHRNRDQRQKIFSRKDDADQTEQKSDKRFRATENTGESADNKENRDNGEDRGKHGASAVGESTGGKKCVDKRPKYVIVCHLKTPFNHWDQNKEGDRDILLATKNNQSGTKTNYEQSA